MLSMRHARKSRHWALLLLQMYEESLHCTHGSSSSAVPFERETCCARSMSGTGSEWMVVSEVWSLRINFLEGRRLVSPIQVGLVTWR
jgi:hypothetical protein